MDLKEFNKTVGAIFERPLGEYGFKLKRKQTARLFCERIYVNGDRYIKIYGDVHPMDSPPHYNIIFGEGSFEWPDCDWNAVALWKIKKDIDRKQRSKEYSLEKIDKYGLQHSLSHARDELLKFGKRFLSGDLGQFDKVRREQNKDREPYKIYRRTDNGGRETIIDEESNRLKKKYS